MHQYYDYCDTYEPYNTGLSLDNKNKIKSFSCNNCKQSKLVLKKSVSDPVFKCEECIEAASKRDKEDAQTQQQETGRRWFSFF